jgi:LacI family transcriptional regulator
MTSKSNPPKIALVGFPILELRPNPTAHALARLILEEKQWEIALAAKEGAGGIRLAEKMGCHGALVRLTNPEMARVARQAHIPLVNVSGWLAAPGVATVKCDNAAIGSLAADHLIEKNFKHLAVMIAPGGALNRERCRGFLEQAARVNLQVECLDSKNFTQTKGRINTKALATWLRVQPKPTGLFLTDDTLALPLLETLLDHNFDVPHDVGIVCGPLHPERGGLCSPSLTTIDPNTSAVYRRALERLEDMMRKPGTARPTMELLAPAGLCPGESTRLSVSEDPLVARAIRLMDAEALRGLNINLLCAKLGVACSTLERHFKGALGVLPHEYLTDLRLAAAKNLLASSDDSIEKIAISSGFSSRKRLNLVFRSTEGVTPLKWRTRCTTKQAR